MSRSRITDKPKHKPVDRLTAEERAEMQWAEVTRATAYQSLPKRHRYATEGHTILHDQRALDLIAYRGGR